MSPLLNVDLFELGSIQVEEYDGGFKYLRHEECMNLRTKETYRYVHVDCILIYIRDMHTKVTCILNMVFFLTITLLVLFFYIHGVTTIYGFKAKNLEIVYFVKVKNCHAPNFVLASSI